MSVPLQEQYHAVAPGIGVGRPPCSTGHLQSIPGTITGFYTLQYDRSGACVNQVEQEGTEVWRVEREYWGDFTGGSIKGAQTRGQEPAE